MPPEDWRRWHEDGVFRRPPRPRTSRRFRLFFPVLLSLAIQLPTTLFWQLRFADGPLPVPIWVSFVTVALAVLGPLALLGRRRFPGPVVAVVSLAAGADLLLADPLHGPPYIALAFAIASAIIHGARVWAWTSVAVVWVASVTLGLVLGMAWSPARLAITTLGILIVFGAGEAMRTRREHYEEYRRAIAQRKQTEVQAERVRIARELHDVLAHSLSQINVQASVALHLMDKQPDKASEALASIKDTSKTALDEVRSVLGVLRAEGGQDPSAPLVPEPDLSRLAGLAASVTSQGVEVSLDNRIVDAPKAVQLAIYRIVQESLTNVVRHANAQTATVELDVVAGSYSVTIDDDGRGMPADESANPSEGGRGLLGMRERAELLGGTLETSDSPRGGVRVNASIPVKEAPE